MDGWMDKRASVAEHTKGGPHRARPQLAVPHCGMEAHPPRPGVLVDYQGVLVAVVDDLPGWFASVVGDKGSLVQKGNKMLEREIHTLGTGASRWETCIPADPC